MIFYHALRTNKYKINDTKVHSLSHWMNSENCWVYGFRVRLPSNRKRSYSFLLTAPGQTPCSVFTIPQVGDGPLSFWGGRGLDSFQKIFLHSKNRWKKKLRVRGVMGQKIGHLLSALLLLFLMLKKFLHKLLSPKTTMYNQKEVRKKISRPTKLPIFHPQKNGSSFVMWRLWKDTANLLPSLVAQMV